MCKFRAARGINYVGKIENSWGQNVTEADRLVRRFWHPDEILFLFFIFNKIYVILK